MRPKPLQNEANYTCNETPKTPLNIPVSRGGWRPPLLIYIYTYMSLHQIFSKNKKKLPFNRENRPPKRGKNGGGFTPPRGGRRGHFTPPMGGLIWVLRPSKKGGQRPPRPPKMVILGSFWPILGQKTLNLSFSAWNGPQNPLKKWFSCHFLKNTWVPPREIAKIEKKVSFSAWNFPKLPKSHEKRGHFQGILGIGGLEAPNKPF